jgi:hypothetical protein
MTMKRKRSLSYFGTAEVKMIILDTQKYDFLHLLIKIRPNFYQIRKCILL